MGNGWSSRNTEIGAVATCFLGHAGAAGGAYWWKPWAEDDGVTVFLHPK